MIDDTMISLLPISVENDITTVDDIFFYNLYFDTKTEHTDSFNGDKHSYNLCSSLNTALDYMIDEINNFSDIDFHITENAISPNPELRKIVVFLQSSHLLTYLALSKHPITSKFLKYALSAFYCEPTFYTSYCNKDDWGNVTCSLALRPEKKEERITIEASLDGYDLYLSSFDNNTSIITKYECHSLFDVCIATLEFLSHENMFIRQCELCGKFFVPSSRSDEKYCDFKNKDYPDKTCKEAAKLINQISRESSNETQKLSKRIYNRLRVRAERKQSEQTKETLYAFQSMREQMKTAVNSGIISETEFLKWLREMDEKTKGVNHVIR